MADPERHTPLRVADARPTGKITDAVPPIAVTIKVKWRGPSDAPADIEEFVDTAWCMAYTRSEALVYWRTDGYPIMAWLPADRVRRREL